MQLTWSFRKQKGDPHAAPTDNPNNKFVVPNYTRGSPYVSATHTYTDKPVRLFTSGSGTEQQQRTARDTRQPYRTVTQQQRQFRDKNGMYPEPGKPPQEWSAYYDEPWQRSQRQEHARGEEGFPNPQTFLRWAPNPYHNRNTVNRPQLTPHEYSFLRPFDREILGERQLNGSHSSQATTSLSSAPLKGMQAPMHRRSTYRLDPVQYTAATIDENQPAPAMSVTFTSPTTGYPPRSFRL